MHELKTGDLQFQMRFRLRRKVLRGRNYYNYR